MASREPVEAPDGTAARPIVPDSSNTSHSTVGLPRLSRISRPTMSTMALTCGSPFGVVVVRCSDGRLDAFYQDHVEVFGLAFSQLAHFGVVRAVVERLGRRVA